MNPLHTGGPLDDECGGLDLLRDDELGAP